MSFLSKEELIELRKKYPQRDIVVYSNFPGGTGSGYVEYGELTPLRADEILKNIKLATLAVSHSKINRPWQLIDVTEKLDRNQAWLGFEVETGWPNKNSFDRAVVQILDSYNHVTIDREGFGEYPTEITFAPEDYNSFVDGKAQIQSFYNWMKEAGVSMGFVPESNVGTHVNISTPAYRAGNYEVKNDTIIALNRGIQLMGYDGVRAVFGRVPYGLAYSRGGDRQTGWIEFKVFRSADSVEGFNRLLEVSKRLSRLVERVASENRKVAKTYSAGTAIRTEEIGNVYQILMGEEEEPKWIDTSPLIGKYGWSYNIRQYLEAEQQRNAA